MRLLLKHTVSSRISFFITFFVYSLWVRKGEITPKSMQKSLILNCFSENTLLHPLSFLSKFAHSFRKSEHEKYVMSQAHEFVKKFSKILFHKNMSVSLFLFFVFNIMQSKEKHLDKPWEKSNDRERHVQTYQHTLAIKWNMVPLSYTQERSLWNYKI